MTQIHPIVVHFPIAWFVTAVGFDVACLVWRRLFWLDRVGLILHGLAVLGAGAAVGSGKLARSDLGALDEIKETMVEQHSEWAFFTLVAFIVVFLLRIESVWRDRGQTEIRLHQTRILSFLAALVALGLIYTTATRGAILVYEFGIAVEGSLIPWR